MADANLTTTVGKAQEIVKCGKDPSYFFNHYVKIQHPVRGLIPFDTFDFQDQCVKSFIDFRYNIILKSRQLGISTLVAAYATWLALFRKDQSILIIATKQKVAQNLIRKVKTIIANLPKWMVLPQVTTNNMQEIHFSHGSSIKAVSTSEDAGRSEALSLLIIDEAAFIRDFDELWKGLYPTLSTGGRAVILSTPNGVGGQYHKLYTDAEAGLNEFHPIKLMWSVHPERDQAWFEGQSRNMSEQQVSQELLCDFLASGDTVLTAGDIEWIGKMVEPPKEKKGPANSLWIWKHPLSEHSYVLSADVSRGDAQDFSAFHVIDITVDEQVAEYKGKIRPDELGDLIAETGTYYNEALVAPENNSYGYAVCMRLRDIGYKRVYRETKNPAAVFLGSYIPSDDLSGMGFHTGPKNRSMILTKMEEVLRNKTVRMYSSRLYDELKTFVWNNNKAQAQKGYNDDLIISLAIGLWLFEASGEHGKQAEALNKAMLAAMGTQRSQLTIPEMTGDKSNRVPWDRFVPIQPSGSKLPSKDKRRSVQDVTDDLSWLFK